MNRFSILWSADHHLDPKNERYVMPALGFIESEAAKRNPDLYVFAGDAWMSRGRVDDTLGWKWRNTNNRTANHCRHGSVMVAGNHDQVFHVDKVDNIQAVMAGPDGATGVQPNVHIHSRIGRRIFPGEDGMYPDERVAVVTIPTPNKFWMAAQIANGPDPDDGLPAPNINGLLHQAIQGQIVGAREDVGPAGVIVVVYHGTVSGCRLGNEMVMTAGVDVAVPHDAFRGADLVIAGHIHHPQTMDGRVSRGAGDDPRATLPAVFYCGALAPLTFNDVALEPRIYQHTIEWSPDGHTIEWEKIPVPVESNMWDVPLDFTECGADEVGDVMARTIRERLDAAMPNAATAGDRVRFQVKAPADVARFISDDMLEAIRAMGDFESVTKIVERVETVSAVMDTERTMSVVEGFKTWLAVQDEPPEGDERDWILELADEAERAITDENVDAHFEFRPRSLRVKNWAQHKDVEIRFGDFGQLVAVRGPNTAGKSNLWRAVPFALFKLQLFGDVIGDVVRIGERDTEVELMFWSHGVLYRVRRTIRKAPSGRGATAKVFFDRFDGPEGGVIVDGPWNPVTEGTAGETDKAIEQLVGPAGLFMATSFANQADVARLLKLKPAPLRDLLQDALHRDFGARAEFVAVGRRKMEKDHGKLAAQMEVHEPTAGKLAERKTALEDAEGAAKTAAAAFIAAEADLTNQRTATGAARESVARIEGKLAGRDAAAAAVETATDAVTMAEIARDQSTLARSEIADLESKREDLGPLDIEGADEKVDKARTAEAAARTALETFRMASAETRDELAGAVAKWSGEKIVATNAATEAATELQRLERAAELLAGVPCAGVVWTTVPGDLDYVNGPVDMGKCQFLLDAKAARDALPAHREKENLLAADRAVAEDADEQARRAFGEYETTYTAELAVLTKAVEDATSGATAARDARQDLRGKATVLESLRSGIDQRTALAAEVETRHAAVVEAERRRDEAVDALSDFKAAGETLATAKAALTTAEADEETAGTARTEADNVKLRADAAVANAHVEYDHALNACAALTAARDMAGSLERKVALCKLYETALGRDGIPQLMMEQMVLPVIQEMTNRYLSETEFRVTVQAEQDNVGKGINAGVYFTFTDRRGEHPVSSASGFQEMAIGAATSNAVAMFHAMATGTRLWFAFQDEGFGAYDDVNLAGAKVTLRTIAEDRQWFVYVSHVDGMWDVADTVMDVTIDPAGETKVEVS